MANNIAFGPDDSYFFNYADRREEALAGLPETVKSLFEKNKIPAEAKVSCLALGHKSQYVVVYSTAGGWFIGESDPGFNPTSTD